MKERDLKFEDIEELIVLGAEIRFVGVLHFNKTKNIINQVENYAKSITDSSKLIKKICFIAIEMLQKITYWNSNKKVYFYFKHVNSKIHILIKDTINSKNKANIVALVDDLNHLSEDKKKLKLYYKHKMTSGKISQKGGQSLGLIQILIKSGNKLFYNFEQQNKDTLKFSLIATIDLT